MKNNDGEGWAVVMVLQGEAEPARVGPWTMGHDKKNPKPLDTAAFNTLVKTTSEVLRRQVAVATAQERVDVTLDIVPDDDDPHALLAARDATGERLAEVRVGAGLRPGLTSATAWIEGGFGRPG